jgi:hypothetical protein
MVQNPALEFADTMGGAMSRRGSKPARFNQQLILGLRERYYPQITQITQITVWGSRRQEDKEAFLKPHDFLSSQDATLT